MRSRSFQLGVLGTTLGVFAGCSPAVSKPDLTADSVKTDSRVTLPDEPRPPRLPDPAAEKLQQAREIFNRAVTYFEEKEWDVALVEFKRALVVDPTFYKAYFKIGLCYYNKQKYDLEIEYYNRCLEIKPDYPEALLNLGNALLARDELEKSVIVYHRVLKNDLKNPVALFNLGLIYYDLQQYELSIKFLDRYNDAYPDGSDRAKADRHLHHAHEKLDAQVKGRPVVTDGK